MASEKYIKFTLEYVQREIVQKESWIASRAYPLWGNCPTRVILMYGGSLGASGYYLDPFYALSSSARGILLYHGKRTGLPTFPKWRGIVAGHVVYYIEYDKKHVVRAERETFHPGTSVRGHEFQRASNNGLQNYYYGVGIASYLSSKIIAGEVEVKNGTYVWKNMPRPGHPPSLEQEPTNIRSADYARLQAEYERHIARLQRNPEP